MHFSFFSKLFFFSYFTIKTTVNPRLVVDYQCSIVTTITPNQTFFQNFGPVCHGRLVVSQTWVVQNQNFLHNAGWGSFFINLFLDSQEKNRVIFYVFHLLEFANNEDKKQSYNKKLMDTCIFNIYDFRTHVYTQIK